MTDPSPLTRAESSGYTETSRHADVLAFIDALVAMGDRRLHVSEFGSTPEGRRLPLLVLSEDGHFTPEAAHASGLPVVLVISAASSARTAASARASMRRASTSTATTCARTRRRCACCRRA
jgi:hypothetical protein